MIVVTGASKGLGRAICERLISKRTDVFGIAQNPGIIPFDQWPVMCPHMKKLRESLRH